MEAYKKEFIEFMVESQVLKFGEFTLKSIQGHSAGCCYRHCLGGAVRQGS